MKSFDFEYDGMYLSDYGFMICNFDSDSSGIVSNGSQIEFNTVSVMNGAKKELASCSYSECLETTFQICKKICGEDNYEISVFELRDLMSWLNRKEFHKFKLIEDDDYYNLYFEASFNIYRIERGGKLVGLELHMTTNRPFALLEPQLIVINNTENNGIKSFVDVSDEEGFIYPNTEITINQSGNLSIYNSLEDRTTYVGNCTAGEVITMNYPIIESSLSAHKIQNDFNWNFLKVVNKFKNRKNELTISIPCTIKMLYSPIVKIGI